MNRFAFLSVVALLAIGCATRGAPPATPTTGALTPAAKGAPPQVVELRHFYLLSPGPSSTLVVTRSDVATAERSAQP